MSVQSVAIHYYLCLTFGFTSVDWKTDHEVKPETLEKILMFNASALLDNSSTDTAKYLQVLAHFILRYVMCIVNKEDFMNNVKVEQANAFSVNPELDKMNKFKCPLCLFTSIDVAAVWFQ